MLVPRGAILRGRIRQLDAHTIPHEHYTVGLEFTELEFPGYHARFFGEMEDIALPAALMDGMTSSQTAVYESGPGQLYAVKRVEKEAYWSRQIPGVSTFSIKRGRVLLPAGLNMIWRTVNLAK